MLCPLDCSEVHDTVALNLYTLDQTVHCLHNVYILNTLTPPSAEENGLPDTEL